MLWLRYKYSVWLFTVNVKCSLKIVFSNCSELDDHLNLYIAL